MDADIMVAMRSTRRGRKTAWGHPAQEAGNLAHARHLIRLAQRAYDRGDTAKAAELQAEARRVNGQVA